MITPILRIFDVNKAKEFYLDYLGFRVDWEHMYEENMPLYMQVSLGDIVVHLSEHHGDGTPGSIIRVKVPDLKSFHTSLTAKDYTYARPGLDKKPWDTIEMAIADPFSNKFIFYEELE